MLNIYLKLSYAGIDVYHKIVVGDNLEKLVEALSITSKEQI